LLPAQFAMVIASPSMPSMPSVLPANGDAVPHAELAARIASGPGLWTDWLEEPGRQGLLEELMVGGVIARALREASTRHRTAGTGPPTRPVRSPACSRRSSPSTAPDASAHPAALPPNAAPGTPEKSPAPSRSRNQISPNGTRNPET
jgi:hypothetical protein